MLHETLQHPEGEVAASPSPSEPAEEGGHTSSEEQSTESEEDEVNLDLTPMHS